MGWLWCWEDKSSWTFVLDWKIRYLWLSFMAQTRLCGSNICPWVRLGNLLLNPCAVYNLHKLKCTFHWVFRNRFHEWLVFKIDCSTQVCIIQVRMDHQASWGDPGYGYFHENKNWSWFLQDSYCQGVEVTCLKIEQQLPTDTVWYLCRKQLQGAHGS